MHEHVKKGARKQLWICIITFLVAESYNLTYNLVLLLLPDKKCLTLTESVLFNQIIWFVSRGFQNTFFIYPLIYLFWPRVDIKDSIRTLEKEDSDGDYDTFDGTWRLDSTIEDK